MTRKEAKKFICKYTGIAALVLATTTFAYSVSKIDKEYNNRVSISYSYILGALGAYMIGRSRREE